MVTKRIPYDQTAPDGLQIMMKMEAYTKTSNINRTTRELIKIRASQLNAFAPTALTFIRKMPEKWEKPNSVFTD